jgi:hypothetical protein
MEMIFFKKHIVNVDIYICMNTHPYEHTRILYPYEHIGKTESA